MTVAAALDALAAHHGVLRSFRDLSKVKHPTSPDTVKALLRANGLDLDNDAMVLDAHKALQAQIDARHLPVEIILPANAPYMLDLPGPAMWQLQIEGSDDFRVQGRADDRLHLPALAAGIHSLRITIGKVCETIALIATPNAAPSIGELTGQDRLWGITGALYGLQSQRNLGLGDYEDLARLGEAAATHGAGFLGVNPIHAFGWSDHETISPYSPSHRGFLNTLHIAADKVPGLETSRKAQVLIAGQRVSMGAQKSDPLIDYSGYRHGFCQLLEALFKIFQTQADAAAQSDFTAFCIKAGTALSDFTLFEALSEIHGPDWRNWPGGVRSVQGADVPKARRRNGDRMRFHAWLQWLATAQVSDAQRRLKQGGAGLGLYLDLAVGPRRGGAETWCEDDSIAQGVSVGAPPDQLSPDGQKWNLAAFAPAKLTATKYRAFRQVLRDTMRHAGMVRIDHVLGMNRSFWIPDDGSPGGYIRQPFQSLLAIIAIEATRAQTAIIGEDLGLVPKGFRKATRARGLYSYSVLQYEKDAGGRFRKPAKLRAHSLACFATHDTPTLEGFRKARDIDWWEKLGWRDTTRANIARQERKSDIAALNTLSAKVDLFSSVHDALAGSPVAMIAVQLDDLTGQIEAQNLPGTIDEHPNWRRKCSMTVEGFATLPALADTQKLMMDQGRATRPVTQKETVNAP